MSARPKMDRIIRVYGSKALKAVEYDPESQTLDVTVAGGSKYRYRNIYAGAFARLVTSVSPGKVFNEEIKKDLYGDARKATKLRVAQVAAK